MQCPPAPSRVGAQRHMGFATLPDPGDGSPARWKAAGSCVGGIPGAAGSLSHRRENSSAPGLGPKGGSGGAAWVPREHHQPLLPGTSLPGADTPGAAWGSHHGRVAAACSTLCHLPPRFSRRCFLPGIVWLHQCWYANRDGEGFHEQELTHPVFTSISGLTWARANEQAPGCPGHGLGAGTGQGLLRLHQWPEGREG